MSEVTYNELKEHLIKQPIIKFPQRIMDMIVSAVTKQAEVEAVIKGKKYICPICNAEVKNMYCGNCGQKVKKGGE